MSEACLIGIDIGTTTSKGVLITYKGKILAEHSMEHGVDRHHSGWAEHDADKVWWGEFAFICRTLLTKAAVDPGQVKAVGCSALYPDVLPVDRGGNPLRSGILYGIDTRAVHEIDLLNEALGKDYSFKVAGNNLSAQSVAPKILWLKRNEPHVFAGTVKFLTATSYIVFRLTGNFVIDHNSASMGGLLYDIAAQCWDAKACEACGISLDQLPELLWSQEVAGHVTADAASETGLAEGTLVIAGSGDFVAELLSLGAHREGQAVIGYGTTFGLALLTKKIAPHPALMFGCSCLPGYYFIGGGLAAGSSLTTWYRNNFGQIEMDVQRSLGISAYHLLSDEAGSVPPGSAGLVALPYFSGERSPIDDPKARGLLIGLTLQHTRGHIYRALLEGVAYGMRHILEVIEEAGFAINLMIAVGGGTRSDVWTQIISDVTRQKQRVMQHTPGAPLGVAFLAGLAAGVVNDINTIDDWVTTDKVVTPHQEDAKIYDHYYRIYRSLYDRNAVVMHDLADLDQ